MEGRACGGVCSYVSPDVGVVFEGVWFWSSVNIAGEVEPLELEVSVFRS